MERPLAPPPAPIAEETGDERPRRPAPTIWQVILSSLAILALWGFALALVGIGLADILSAQDVPSETVSLFLWAAGLTLSGALVIPSLVYALSRLLGRSVALPGWLTLGLLRLALLLLPFVLLIGHWISLQPALAWLVLPPLHALALGLPIAWLLWVGIRGLPAGPPQRAWGVFGAGLVVGPALILVLEAIAALAVVTLFLASEPGVTEELMALVERARRANLTPEDLSNALTPFLEEPGIPITVFLFLAGIVPVVEELFKPIGVWFLLGRNLTPAEGFVAGLLSGAGYALAENLALSSQTESWAIAVTARAGPGLLHMVNAGLFGWALVGAWRHRRYARMVVTYLLVVFLHGLWNGLSLFAFASALDPSATSAVASIPQSFGRVAPFGLLLLTVVAFAILLFANRNLQKGRAELAARPAG